ncbi:putative redoxin domain-containing protein [Magnetofaba australis IT-1]|uniref:Putative redoxin domain-containing protein n=1 Tax=Magnetofaba australis IT-1 TaxID=1434232 RepID=A0A1Y2K057_9PROT|nr:putative redoxin domain-containing protein [Magnetofaba australis IT-1]
MLAAPLAASAQDDTAGASSALTQSMQTPLATLDGKSLTLDGLKGQVVLLNFWATWCPPCREEIPHLVEAQRTYKERGFTVVGVTWSDRSAQSKLARFVARMRINYPIIYDTDRAKMIQFARGFGGVYALPVSLLLDREGRIVRLHTGAVTMPMLEKWIEPMLIEG